MRKCLIISAYFPPMGGIGVQRILKFAKYLNGFGWNPLIASIPINSTKEVQDNTLLAELPKELKIFRPFYFDYRKIIPGEIAKLFRKFEQTYLFPDKYQIWNLFLRHRLKKIIDDNNIEIIYINVPPFSTIDITEFLGRNFHLPVILSFRDPFSFNNYYVLNPNPVQEKSAYIKEKKAFQFASKIVCVTPFQQKKYMEIFPEYKDKFALITNGFDEQDFCFSSPIEKKEHLQIGYSGSVSSLVPLKPVLEAIYEIYIKFKIRIVLNMATPNKKSKIRKIHPLCFSADLVDIKGFLPHHDSIDNLKQSDLLLLMFANDPSTEGSYPGKVFEYFKVGKPILLLHQKEGILSDLIKKTATGTTLDIDDHRSIVEYLLNAHKKWQNGILDYRPNEHEIEKFNYRNLTKKLANLFTELTLFAEIKGENK